MPVVVPGDGADTIAGANSGRFERVRKLARTPEHFGPRRAVPRVVARHGHDLAIRKIAVGEPHDLRDQERRVHHHSEHATFPSYWPFTRLAVWARRAKPARVHVTARARVAW